MALVAHCPLVPAQSRPRIRTIYRAVGAPTTSSAEKVAVQASRQRRKDCYYNLKYNIYFSQNILHWSYLIPC